MSTATRYEDLQSLLTAIKAYKEVLDNNFTILRNAANVCDAAMGSDELSQKHIANLEEALKELSKATQIAESAITAITTAIHDYDEVN